MELGEDGGGSLGLFKDFGIEVADSADLDLLLKAKQAGEISQLTFLKELKRRNLLSDDFDPQTEIDLLDIESAGSATTDEAEDAFAMAQTGERPEPKHEGRNVVGDTTSAFDDHRHVLEEGGRTSRDASSDGTQHDHEWNEFGIRTSVDNAHSHILLTRAAQTKAAKPVMTPSDDDDDDDDDGDEGNKPFANTGDDE